MMSSRCAASGPAWRRGLLCLAAALVPLLAALLASPPGSANDDSSTSASWTERVIPPEARDFWSFRPLAAVVPPDCGADPWPTTPVDHFILARLQKERLAPNPIAEKTQLIRRAYFDLLGLPPTVAEVEAFLADNSTDAWNALLDRLLESPHYGERWGRHWLDVARFAESHGFEHDSDRPTAYHYRDFVIQALNLDLPFDTFVKWQIAGDEFAPDNNLALMATGFLAAGVHSTQITKNEVEKHRYDELDDILGTIGQSMLGLSIQCARCHDHKYDPIPQRDYYRLLSTFTTTVRSEIDLDMDPEGYLREKQEFDKAHAPLVQALEQFEREEIPSRLAAWEARGGAQSAERFPWIILEPRSQKSDGGATLTRQPDGSFLVTGTNSKHDLYTFSVPIRATGLTALRIEALSDASMIKGGPGRAANGNFDLTDLKVTIAPGDGSAPAEKGATQPAPVAVRLKNPRATFEQPGLPVAAVIDDNDRSGWAVDPQFGKDHSAAFEFESPVGFEEGSLLTVTLTFKGNDQHNLGRVRLAVTAAREPVELQAAGLSQSIARTLALPQAERSADQKQALAAWYQSMDPEWQERNRPVQEHLAAAPKKRLAKAMISSEGLPAVRLHTQGGDFLEQTHFLRRGDPNLKDAVATPGFLQVLDPGEAAHQRWQESPPPGWRTSYRRRSLANWLTDVDQGAGALVARVIVNRLWQHHLGRGLVATPNDFGLRGAPPTHPELLDYLAGRLIENGWRLKPIHKLIMQSAVYRQSSRFHEEHAAIDRDNLLCWRRTPVRLEAEVIRDSLLATSGLLDRTQFGPGTLDESSRRRSIYFTVKRSKLLAMMQVFDAPDALSSIGERPTTTVAPQALLLMNNPRTREGARALAERLAQTADPAERVRLGYRSTVARLPSPEELADGLAFIQGQAATYAANTPGESQRLALTDFCQVLMCLNEFVYIE
ncbi:MAG: DUF1549 and DUF1553 domain-containing protein [Planctomycetales bacterium]